MVILPISAASSSANAGRLGRQMNNAGNRIVISAKEGETMIYQKEHIVVENLEQVHTARNPTIMAGIALMKEICQNLDKDGHLPLHSMGYLQEKMELILQAIK